MKEQLQSQKQPQGDLEYSREFESASDWSAKVFVELKCNPWEYASCNDPAYYHVSIKSYRKAQVVVKRNVLGEPVTTLSQRKEI